MQETPSMQSLEHTVRVTPSSLWRIPREHNMHALHMQHVQALQLDDYAPRIAFAQWYLGKPATDLLFPAKVLFSSEVSFTREEIFNMHNVHIWVEEENPHAIL